MCRQGCSQVSKMSHMDEGPFPFTTLRSTALGNLLATLLLLLHVIPQMGSQYSDVSRGKLCASVPRKAHWLSRNAVWSFGVRNQAKTSCGAVTRSGNFLKPKLVYWFVETMCEFLKRGAMVLFGLVFLPLTHFGARFLCLSGRYAAGTLQRRHKEDSGFFFNVLWLFGPRMSATDPGIKHWMCCFWHDNVRDNKTRDNYISCVESLSKQKASCRLLIVMSVCTGNMEWMMNRLFKLSCWQRKR